MKKTMYVKKVYRAAINEIDDELAKMEAGTN